MKVSIVSKVRILLSKIPRDVPEDRIPLAVKVRVAESFMNELQSYRTDKPVVFTDSQNSIDKVFEKVDSGAFLLVAPEDTPAHLEEHLRVLREKAKAELRLLPLGDAITAEDVGARVEPATELPSGAMIFIDQKSRYFRADDDEWEYSSGAN